MVDFENAIRDLLYTGEYEVYTGSLPTKLPNAFIQVLLLGGRPTKDNVVEDQTVIINFYAKEEFEARQMCFLHRNIMRVTSGSADTMDHNNMSKLEIGGVMPNPDPDEPEYTRFSFQVEGATINKK